jgi:hypothetical protein
MADRAKSLKLRTISERRHNGGLVVKVYELASSGTFTFSLAQGGGASGLQMFASADEAQHAADERLRSEGHDCALLGCRAWIPPAAATDK